MTKLMYDWKQKPGERMKKPSMLNLNSRKHVTSVVHNSKRVLILRIQKKTSTVITVRNMYTQLNNVTSRMEKTSTVNTARKIVTRSKNALSGISARNNACTITRRVTKKRTSGRKKTITRKNKGKLWFKI